MVSLFLHFYAAAKFQIITEFKILCPLAQRNYNINLSVVDHLIVRSNGSVKLDNGIDQAQYCGCLYVFIL